MQEDMFNHTLCLCLHLSVHLCQEPSSWFQSNVVGQAVLSNTLNPNVKISGWTGIKKLRLMPLKREWMEHEPSSCMGWLTCSFQGQFSDLGCNSVQITAVKLPDTFCVCWKRSETLFSATFRGIREPEFMNSTRGNVELMLKKSQSRKWSLSFWAKKHWKLFILAPISQDSYSF